MSKIINGIVLLAAAHLYGAPLATTNYVQAALQSYDMQLRYILADMGNTNLPPRANGTVSVSNHIATVTYVETNGVVVGTRRYALEMRVERATKLGCKVIASTIPGVAVGMCFAGVDAPARFVNSDAPIPFFYSSSTNNTYAYTLSATNGYDTYATVSPPGKSIEISRFVHAGTNIIWGGSAELIPWYLSPSEWTTACGNSFAGASELTNATWITRWCETNGITAFQLQATELYDSTTSYFTPFSFIPKAYAAAGTTYTPLDLDPKFIGDPTVQIWPDPDPTHYYSPNRTPSEADWFNPDMWSIFPFIIQFETTIRGKTYVTEVKVNTMAEASQYGITIKIPPRPFPYPKLCKYDIGEACIRGVHSWRQCVCKVCGISREHNFAGDCATCDNENTDAVKDGTLWVGISRGVCGEKSEDPNKHSGWHDDGDCVCACGHLHLAHTFDDTPAPGMEWMDYSETEHIGVALCTRCYEAKKQIVREHNYGPPSEGGSEYEPYDDNYHRVKPDLICEAKGCGHVSKGGGEATYEAHSFSHEDCTCTKCGFQKHQSVNINPCGLEYCGYCDTVLDETAGHIFGVGDIDLGSSGHRCLCGEKLSNGAWKNVENHTWGEEFWSPALGGYVVECTVCGWRTLRSDDEEPHRWPEGVCGPHACIASHRNYCADPLHPSVRLISNLPHEGVEDPNPTPYNAGFHEWKMVCYLSNPELPSPHTISSRKEKHDEKGPRVIVNYDDHSHYWSKSCSVCGYTNNTGKPEGHTSTEQWTHNGDVCNCEKICVARPSGCLWTNGNTTDQQPYDAQHLCKHCGTKASPGWPDHDWDLQDDPQGEYIAIAHCEVCGQTKSVRSKFKMPDDIDEDSSTHGCPHGNPFHGHYCLCWGWQPKTDADTCPYCLGNIEWEKTLFNVTIRYDFTTIPYGLYRDEVYLHVGRVDGGIVSSFLSTESTYLGTGL